MKDDKKKQDLSKEERISEEVKRLGKLFTKMEPKVKKAVESLIQNAAFMAISLDELQGIINREGYTEEYQNGVNQFGVKKRSEVEIYNAMIKNHSSILKQLTDLLPKDLKPKKDDDGFDEFVNSK